MSIFPFFRKATKTADTPPEHDGGNGENLPFLDNFTIFNTIPYNGEPYLINAWVNICVNTLARNAARASFVIEKEGETVKRGRLYDLFRRPSERTSRYDLFKETAAWFALEGESFYLNHQHRRPVSKIRF